MPKLASVKLLLNIVYVMEVFLLGSASPPTRPACLTEWSNLLGNSALRVPSMLSSTRCPANTIVTGFSLALGQNCPNDFNASSFITNITIRCNDTWQYSSAIQAGQCQNYTPITNISDAPDLGFASVPWRASGLLDSFGIFDASSNLYYCPTGLLITGITAVIHTGGVGTYILGVHIACGGVASSPSPSSGYSCQVWSEMLGNYIKRELLTLQNTSCPVNTIVTGFSTDLGEGCWSDMNLFGTHYNINNITIRCNDTWQDSNAINPIPCPNYTRITNISVTPDLGFSSVFWWAASFLEDFGISDITTWHSPAAQLYSCPAGLWITGISTAIDTFDLTTDSGENHVAESIVGVRVACGGVGGASGGEGVPAVASGGGGVPAAGSGGGGGGGVPIVAMVVPVVMVVVLLLLGGLAGALLWRRTRLRRQKGCLKNADSVPLSTLVNQCATPSGSHPTLQSLYTSQVYQSSGTMGASDSEAAPLLIHSDSIHVQADGEGQAVELGEGAFSKVYAGVYGPEKLPVALKVIKENEGGSEAMMKLLNEVSLLRACQSLHIVTFYGPCFFGVDVVLVFERMAGDLMHALGGPRRQSYMWYNKGGGIMLDVARGLEYLHGKRIVHRDIKSLNVLLTADDRAKIGDMGMSKVMLESLVSKGDMLGTMAYAAPELYERDSVTNKVDVYAAGVVLWELVTGERPCVGKLREPKVPEECPAEVAELIQRCMCQAEGRPSSQQLREELELLLGIEH